MKRRLKYLSFIIVAIIGIIAGVLILFSNENKNTISVDTISERTEVAIYGGYEEQINIELEKIPSWMYEDLMNESSITVLDIPDKEEVVGKYYILAKNIEIDLIAIEYATLHEVGHFIDYKYNYSQTEEFKAIFKEESKFMGSYFQTNEREYFAECFKHYWNGRLEIQSQDCGYYTTQDGEVGTISATYDYFEKEFGIYK